MIIEFNTMLMSRNFIVIALLFLSVITKVNAQFGFSHELGAIVGPVAFQSDYGQQQVQQ